MKYFAAFLSRLLPFILLGAALSGCGPIVRPVHLGAQTPYFIPPSPVVSPTPPPSATPKPGSADSAGQGNENSAGQDPQCRNNLTFVKDITIPDKTVVAAESTMDKRWEVENSGDCNWTDKYRIRLIAGPEMGAQKEQALFPARSGTHTIIRLQFKAPAEPGNYQSAWQAYNPQGEPFGDAFFINITVGNP